MGKCLLWSIFLLTITPYGESRCGLETVILNEVSFNVNKCKSIVGTSDSEVCSCIEVNKAEQIFNCILKGDSISNELSFFDLNASTVALNYETCFDSTSPLILNADENEVQVLPIDLIVKTTNLYTMFPIFKGLGQEYSVLGMKYRMTINTIDFEDNPKLSTVDLAAALINPKATGNLQGIKIANSFSARRYEVLDLNLILSNNLRYIYLNNVSALVDLKLFVPNNTEDVFSAPIQNGPLESGSSEDYTDPGFQLSKTKLLRQSFYYIINRDMISQTLVWNLSPENEVLFWPSVFSTKIADYNIDNTVSIELCDSIQGSKMMKNLNKEVLMFSGLVYLSLPKTLETIDYGALSNGTFLIPRKISPCVGKTGLMINDTMLNLWLEGNCSHLAFSEDGYFLCAVCYMHQYGLYMAEDNLITSCKNGKLVREEIPTLRHEATCYEMWDYPREVEKLGLDLNPPMFVQNWTKCAKTSSAIGLANGEVILNVAVFLAGVYFFIL